MITKAKMVRELKELEASMSHTTVHLENNYLVEQHSNEHCEKCRLRAILEKVGVKAP